ncbi:DUF2809 domain-containing protein [Glutamicibacter sp. V16R2B1]|nr:DUF2809 domain-containing protein [Glutamicibacter sp. V16R2B1]
MRRMVLTRRAWMGITALLVVPIGLFARFLPLGLAADLAGGLLYATLLYVLLGFLFPRAARLRLFLGSLGWCVAVELLQLTPLPLQLAQSLPILRLVLGTSFAVLDLFAYVAGAALAWTVDGLICRTRAHAQAAREL